MRAFRPEAETVSVRAEGRTRPVALQPRARRAASSRATVDGATLPLRYELEVAYPDGNTLHDARPVRASRRRSARSTCTWRARAATRSSTAGSARTCASIDGVAGHVVRRLGAGAHARCRSSATSTPGTGGCTRCARWAPAGIWELFVPGVREPAAALQVRDPHRSRRPADEGRPVRVRGRGPARDLVGRQPLGARVGRRRVAADPRRGRAAQREPISIYEVHLGSWRLNPLEDSRSLTYAELADELAAYAHDMGFTHLELLPVHGPPVRRLVGLSGDLVLRPHAALRHARRAPRVRRPPARPRPRRDPRLGPRALPQGRLGAAALRRHGALRARRPAPRRAPRLGHAGLQLRAQRGPQLPAGQRAVLAARVPRRRPAGRRRRLDALPRLLPQGGRVGAQRARRPRGPRGRRVPQGAQRGRPRARCPA